MNKPFPPQRPAERRQQAMQAVADALGSMRYGTISLTVHDAEVVQMEVTEKRRFGH